MKHGDQAPCDVVADDDGCEHVVDNSGDAHCARAGFTKYAHVNGYDGELCEACFDFEEDLVDPGELVVVSCVLAFWEWARTRLGMPEVRISGGTSFLWYP